MAGRPRQTWSADAALAAHDVHLVRQAGVELQRRVAGRELNALDYFPRSYDEFRVYPPRMIAAAIGAVVTPAPVAIALMLMRV